VSGQQRGKRRRRHKTWDDKRWAKQMRRTERLFARISSHRSNENERIEAE